MNSLIKYGLYFVVAFSVLAFSAAEVWAFSIVELVVFMLVFLWFAGGLGADLEISHRHTQTFCSADPSTICRSYPRGMDFVFHRAGGAGFAE